MSRGNFTALTISISLFGLLWLAAEFGAFNLGFNGAMAIVSIFYGIASVFFSINTEERGLILLGTVVFITGVIFLAITNYEMLTLNILLLSGLFTAVGAGLLMLYIENPKEKTFLFTGIAAFLLTYFSISGIIPTFVIDLAGGFSSVIYSYSPIFIILFGVIFLISGRNEAQD